MTRYHSVSVVHAVGLPPRPADGGRERRFGTPKVGAAAFSRVDRRRSLRRPDGSGQHQCRTNSSEIEAAAGCSARRMPATWLRRWRWGCAPRRHSPRRKDVAAVGANARESASLPPAGGCSAKHAVLRLAPSRPRCSGSRFVQNDNSAPSGPAFTPLRPAPPRPRGRSRSDDVVLNI